MNKIFLFLILGLVTFTSFANSYVNDTGAQLEQEADELLDKNNDMALCGVWKDSYDIYKAKMILEAIQQSPVLRETLHYLIPQLQRFIDNVSYVPTARATLDKANDVAQLLIEVRLTLSLS